MTTESGKSKAAEGAPPEVAADDPKGWSKEKKQAESYMPPLSEYVAHGYKAETYEDFVKTRTEKIKAMGLEPHSNRIIHPEGKYYVIEPALKATRQNLTMAQRNSSMFSEAPRIMGKTLRRGSKLLLSDAQMNQNALHIGRLYKAHAIEISEVQEDGSTVSMREMEKARKTPVVMKEDEGMDEAPEMPPEAPKDPSPPAPFDPNVTMEMKIVPPPAALPGGPDPSEATPTVPINPTAAAADAEVTAAIDSLGESDSGSKKKGSKKAKKE